MSKIIKASVNEEPYIIEAPPPPPKGEGAKKKDSEDEHLSAEETMGLISSLQHKKEALAFIKFCVRPDVQVRYAKLLEVFPAYEDALELFMLTSGRRLRVYGDILTHAKTLPNITITGTIMEILKRILAVCATQIVEGRFTQASLDRELDKAAKEIEYLLSIYEG